MPIPRKLFLQLRYKIEEAGYKLQEISAHFGHSPSWASSRLSGQTPWSVADALEVCELVGIPKEEAFEYFKDALVATEKKGKTA